MRNEYKVSRHPISHIKKIFENEKEEIKCSYSLYSYVPHSIKEYRQEHTVPIHKMTEEWLSTTLSSLLPDQELAFHSIIRKPKNVYHIPMIDLGGRSREINNLPVIKELATFWDINFSIFSSGRSYHLYGNRLLSESEWIKFMGSLLLLNIPGKSKIVDNRWVGHRLLGGYASLRWSNNTSHYKRYPTYIGGIDELSKGSVNLNFHINDITNK